MMLLCLSLLTRSNLPPGLPGLLCTLQKYNSIKKIKVKVLGTMNTIGPANRTEAFLLLASTSAVYVDPKVQLQVEEYWDNVNPIGVRCCYDEGK